MSCDTPVETAPICFSHHSESNDMQHDLLWPDLTSDLWSNLDFDFLKSNWVLSDLPRREEQNGRSRFCSLIPPQVNGLGSRCQSLPRSSTNFYHQSFFFNNFWSIAPKASILLPLCFSCWDKSNDTQFDSKSRSRFDLRSEVRSGQSRSCCIYFDSEWWYEHIGVIIIVLYCIVLYI